MKLYGLKNCDTCRKALKSLEAAGHSPTFVDVRQDGVSPSDLARFYDAFEMAILNTRSTTWRGLSEEQKGQNPLKLLQEFPALMKRPVIETGTGLTLGWAKDVQAKYL